MSSTVSLLSIRAGEGCVTTASILVSLAMASYRPSAIDVL